jgi:thiamine kinase
LSTEGERDTAPQSGVRGHPNPTLRVRSRIVNVLGSSRRNDPIVRPRMGDGKLLAQGREAEVYLQADGTVLKLWRDPADAWRLDREVAALNALAGTTVAVPAVLGTVVKDGRPGLVINRIEGVDLLSRLGHQPFSVFRAGRTLGVAHAELHDIVAPLHLPELNDDLRLRIREAAPLPKDLRRAALDLLDGLPGGGQLCHGDFHLGNMIGDWSTPVVIDWGDASRGDPVADLARTYLLQKLGEPPPGATLLLRVLAPLGRDILAARYLSTYRSRRPVDQRRFDEWQIVRAAARLFDPVPSEHARLIRFLHARLNS